MDVRPLTNHSGRHDGSRRTRGVFKRWPALAVWLSLLALGACRPPPSDAWSGYVEGDYVYVSAPVAGTLAALEVQRGASVPRAAPLFSLDAPAEDAARAEAEARVQAARAQAANTGKGRRGEELAVTAAQLAQARAQAALAEKEWARQRRLVEQGYISAARADDARTAARQARARVDELSAAMAVARLPARPDEQRAAEASASAAQAGLALTQWRESQTRRTAPTDGVVADTFFRVGEWVPAGQPVLSLLPTDGVKARFYVDEKTLSTLAVGQGVSLHCDGCGEPVRATVDFVATQPEYTPPVIYSNAQRERLVYRVEARPAAGAGARLKPGQPLDVRMAPPKG